MLRMDKVAVVRRRVLVGGVSVREVARSMIGLLNVLRHIGIEGNQRAEAIRAGRHLKWMTFVPKGRLIERAFLKTFIDMAHGLAWGFRSLRAKSSSSSTGKETASGSRCSSTGVPRSFRGL
jgi:hypothetical protein